jgi:hypothetical protein
MFRQLVYLHASGALLAATILHSETFEARFFQWGWEFVMTVFYSELKVFLRLAPRTC